MHSRVHLVFAISLFSAATTLAQTSTSPSKIESGSGDAPAKSPAQDTPSTKPSKGDKPSSKDKAIEPKVAPGSLPSPTLGLAFDKDETIIDAVKLVENNDADAAEWLLKNALAKGGLTEERKDEVRLALAMVYIRGGELTGVHAHLSKFLSKSKDVEDTSVSDPLNKVRRAQVLDLARGVVAKMITKDSPAPASSGESWLGVLRDAAKQLKANLEHEHKDILRAAQRYEWDAVTKDVGKCRELVEQMDCLRGCIDSGSWKDATEKYASTMTEVVAACSKRGHELKSSLPGLGHDTHLSAKEPGRWWPLGAVNKYNDARSSLEGAINSGKFVIEHYVRAKSKWNQEKAFGPDPALGLGKNDVPPVKDPALKH